MKTDSSKTSSPPFTAHNSWGFLDKESKPNETAKRAGQVTNGKNINTNTSSLIPSTRKLIDNNQSP